MGNKRLQDRRGHGKEKTEKTEVEKKLPGNGATPSPVTPPEGEAYSRKGGWKPTKDREELTLYRGDKRKCSSQHGSAGNIPHVRRGKKRKKDLAQKDVRRSGSWQRMRGGGLIS